MTLLSRQATMRISLLVVVLLGCMSLSYAADIYNASHVRYVDYDKSTTNYLFRSGEPKTAWVDPKFAWDEISATFAQRAEEQNLPWNPDFYMVDLCLLTTEADDIAMEKQYFEDNPNKGTFIHWPIYGMNLTYIQNACTQLNIPLSECQNEQPQNFTEANRAAIAKSLPTLLNGDQLPERLEQTHKLLTTPQSGKHVVALGHCECGCDRTGEFFASYYMKYQNKTFTEAMTYDVGVPDRNIGYGNQLAAQWYCNYLYYTGQYNDRPYDCNNCEPFRCSGDEPQNGGSMETTGAAPVSRHIRRPRTVVTHK